MKTNTRPTSEMFFNQKSKINNRVPMRETNKSAVIGAAPEGARDTHAAASAVRQMFTAIAPRYDLLNHILSFNVDRLWWRRTARSFREILWRPNSRVVDLCCGTGDMTFALAKSAARSEENGTSLLGVAGWVEADALSLPFPNGYFDLVTSAFGFRNLADYDAGLREIVRVLGPGGECGILDFSEPKGLMGSAYRLYFKHVLPRVGTMISGVRGPYAYLPATLPRQEVSPLLFRVVTLRLMERTWAL
jgi:demethylmenaquinone methyltransferase/2-methoxy-6-polyprenyl-1,4-benzoquinol methylase